MGTLYVMTMLGFVLKMKYECLDVPFFPGRKVGDLERMATEEPEHSNQNNPKYKIIDNIALSQARCK
jgi:hypothetical protein